MQEMLKRIDVSKDLKEGALVYEKSWGSGVVRQFDPFYGKVVIDFDTKQGHRMMLSYASECLRLMDEEHLHSIRRRDPERFNDMLENHPDELIRVLIRSYGPQPIQNVQSILIPVILAEGDWKSFWERARKALKKDPLFEIPRKRNEPLRVLKVEKGYNEHWYARLRKERDMQEIIRSVDELVNAKDRPEITEDFAEVLSNRLAFVVKGAGSRLPGLAARAVMAARELNIQAEEMDTDRLLSALLDEEAFLSAIRDVPAKEIRRLLNHLRAVDHEHMEALLLRLIPQLDMPVLNETLPLLMEQGRTEEVAAIIRDLTKERQVADVEVLYWIYRHPDVMAQWNLGGLPELVRWLLRVLNEQLAGEKLKTQNLIRDAFERKDWLKSVMESMNHTEAREFMRRVKDSIAWDSITQRSIMANLIKMKPELQEVVAEDRAPEKNNLTGRVTSNHSYYERQDQLEHIITVEIPEVAKEIGVARSHGDLRENFEYKAAKEKQAFLLRRRAELESMLSQVVPSDFSNVPFGLVAQGAGVLLEYADGHQERYYILGEWDRDEALGIISSESRLAQKLIGAKEDDIVQVPSSLEEDQECRVLAVEPLSEAVRTWIEMQ
ncbi:MAG: GreA/GreB family elongation factor [Kiritimatiellae bacterium]|nr:GreA/GreB family elongation factor [Kiritimatiellia bacterium]